MSALRIARSALRARPAAIARPIQRRGYAEVASDKIKLSLALPHQTIFKSQDVVQVNLAAETGDMGVLANHVASIEQLKPGLVEIIEESGSNKQFFLSGGFAVVQPDSKLSINAVEGYPLEDFSADAVRNQIAEAQKIASGSGSEVDIAEAKIELEVLESLQAALKTTGGAPSQLGVNTASESRTPGSSEANPQLKPRPEPEPKITTPDPLPLSFVRQLAKPVSVQAAKDFFESKAAQGRSAPPLPPAQAAVIAKGAVTRQQVNRPQPPTSPLHQSKGEVTQPVPITEFTSHVNDESKPDEESILTRQSSEASTQLDSSWRVDRFSHPRTDSPTRANVRGAVKPQDSSTYKDDLLAPDNPEANAGQRQSNIVFETVSRDTNAEGEAVNKSSEIDNPPNVPLIAVDYTTDLDPSPDSNKSVREHPAHRSNSEAESHEGAAERPTSYSQAQRPKLSRTVRETVEENHTTQGKRVRRRESRSASLRKEETLAERRARYEPRKSPAIGLGQPSKSDQGRLSNKTADDAAGTFGHDGSSSTTSSSGQSTALGANPNANIRTRYDHEIRIPDHVDWHGAYGRRKTQDFGFPGARIKPRGTYRTYRPLQDPSKWTKRACGHFSYLTTTEPRNKASEKLCHQCTAYQSFQSKCEPVQHAQDWPLRYPLVPPREAEKLNVGAPRQRGPTMNDSRSRLRKSVKTLSHLIELVDSTADDLGIDLDRRPTASEDQLFHNAPVQGSPSTSASPYRSAEILDNIIFEDIEVGNDSWSVVNRRSPTKLIEPRVTLKSNIDSSFEDFDVQLQERYESELESDTAQKIIAKSSTNPARKSSRPQHNITEDEVIREWLEIAQPKLSNPTKRMPGSYQSAEPEARLSHDDYFEDLALDRRRVSTMYAPPTPEPETADEEIVEATFSDSFPSEHRKTRASP
ncbi:delta subunit of the central stalk of mitochondrial F1F0 ATP synthase, atp16 [Neodidymelliopsis sp. IMI 364377]|nr:delta subunit of the central stalk of mitochondrial F1F0 ATP synthase, atp16 [Neodidymelliopsis sp. IMI 364377]